jgi:glycosyltransferase involved in cell wall biosynthesis
MAKSIKILLLTFYYPPDLSAGSFRAQSLVDALQREAGDRLSIDVVTTVPNRYASYQQDAALHETFSNVSITRIPLPLHQSGIADQSRVFISFAKKALSETQGKQWDLVVATSSRLMTAALGTLIARRSGARLYLDIRDLFTDTMADLLKGSSLRFAIPIFRLVERYSFRAANRVNFVSEGFANHGKRVAPLQSFRFYTNGIDDEFLDADFKDETPRITQPLVVLYAGNMGDGQGLHLIIPEVARRLKGRVHFKLIGAGGRRRELEAALKRDNSNNVELLTPISRAELHDEYRAADILFLHLNDYDAFKKVLPSKVFEYAATGKRMLAGVAGYAADFLRKEVEGCAVFTPCNADEMIASFETLIEMPPMIDRQSFKSRFARTTIMDQMASDVMSVASAP